MTLRRRSKLGLLALPDSECPNCGGPVMYQPLKKKNKKIRLPHRHSLCAWCTRLALCAAATAQWGDIAEGEARVVRPEMVWAKEGVG